MYGILSTDLIITKEEVGLANSRIDSHIDFIYRIDGEYFGLDEFYGEWYFWIPYEIWIDSAKKIRVSPKFAFRGQMDSSESPTSWTVAMFDIDF